jgi:outer membrane receptor protein involved in Fe transport
MIVGGRWYEVDRAISYNNDKPKGYQVSAETNRQATDDGFLPKYGLQFQVTDDAMVYGLYSEGFRVGGTNRGRGIPTLPVAYDSDIIENTEFGLKSTWMDGRLQVNATIYEMKWKDMQLEVTDPSFAIGQPWQAVVANLGDAEISGYDLDVTGLIGDNISFGFNITKIDDAFVSPNTLTYPDDRFPGGQVSLGLAAKQNLPMFADTSYSMYFEYSTKMGFFGGGDGFVRLQHSYNGDSLNQLSDDDNAPRQAQGDYMVTDIVLGYDLGDWKAQLSANNMFDERGVSYKDSSDFDTFYGRNSNNVIRPRNFSLSIRRFF